MSRTKLDGWKKYLEEYGITEELFLQMLVEVSKNAANTDPQTETIWRMIYQINLTAHHTRDDALMERTYRTMAVMTYDLGEDSKNLIELSMQYRLIQLDEASYNGTKYSQVELAPGCDDCFAGKRMYKIEIARSLIPLPCSKCRNQVDKEHPFGLCRCTWIPSMDRSEGNFSK